VIFDEDQLNALFVVIDEREGKHQEGIELD
jgi:hypothetical protein